VMVVVLSQMSPATLNGPVRLRARANADIRVYTSGSSPCLRL
jgi:hypothetical protein